MWIHSISKNSLQLLIYHIYFDVKAHLWLTITDAVRHTTSIIVSHLKMGVSLKTFYDKWIDQVNSVSVSFEVKDTHSKSRKECLIILQQIIGSDLLKVIKCFFTKFPHMTWRTTYHLKAGSPLHYLHIIKKKRCHLNHQSANHSVNHRCLKQKFHFKYYIFSFHRTIRALHLVNGLYTVDGTLLIFWYCLPHISAIFTHDRKRYCHN